MKHPNLILHDNHGAMTARHVANDIEKKNPLTQIHVECDEFRFRVTEERVTAALQEASGMGFFTVACVATTEAIAARSLAPLPLHPTALCLHRFALQSRLGDLQPVLDDLALARPYTIVPLARKAMEVLQTAPGDKLACAWWTCLLHHAFEKLTGIKGVRSVLPNLSDRAFSCRAWPYIASVQHVLLENNRRSGMKFATTQMLAIRAINGMSLAHEFDEALHYWTALFSHKDPFEILQTLFISQPQNKELHDSLMAFSLGQAALLSLNVSSAQFVRGDGTTTSTETELKITRPICKLLASMGAAKDGSQAFDVNLWPYREHIHNALTSLSFVTFEWGYKTASQDLPQRPWTTATILQWLNTWWENVKRVD